MARQDKSRCLHMTRASPERRYGELLRSKVDVEQGVQKAIRQWSEEEEVRKHRDRVTGAWKQISKQRRRVDASYDPSTSIVPALQHAPKWYMDWWREIQNDLYQEIGRKLKHWTAFLRHIGSGLHAETGHRKVYAWKVCEWQTYSIEAKGTFEDGCGRNYANSQSASQNRQDAISRVSAVQESARSPRLEHWQSGN